MSFDTTEKSLAFSSFSYCSSCFKQLLRFPLNFLATSLNTSSSNSFCSWIIYAPGDLGSPLHMVLWPLNAIW